MSRSIMCAASSTYARNGELGMELRRRFWRRLKIAHRSTLCVIIK